MYYDQSAFDLRCDWGLSGLLALKTSIDSVVVVDVTSFSTAVDVAVSRGAVVYPYRWKDDSAREFAVSKGAYLACRRSLDEISRSRIAENNSRYGGRNYGSTLEYY